MPSEGSPISSAQFAIAIEELPLENLYAKVFEIRNSISHLEDSNKELEEYSQTVGGDTDCVAAVAENREVIGRMKERVELVKREVERRGQKWHEGDGNGAASGEGAAGGSLDDERLRRLMEARMAEEEEEDGVHL